MKQLTLEMKSTDHYNDHDYIVSDCNQEAYSYIANSQNIWGISPYENFLLLCGPISSGKTYLAKIWIKRVGAVILSPLELIKRNYIINSHLIIEDIDYIDDEEQLFHFFNNRINSNYKTLFTSKSDLKDFKLQDINSRIKSINRILIKEPNEDFIKMLIIKLFSDRSIKINQDILNYLIYRLPRNYEAIYNFINNIDKESLTLKREITIPLLSKIFKN
jgi:chromosomal replication initiation ATPase DnaA